MSLIRWTSCGMPWPVTAEIGRTSRQSSRPIPLAGLGGVGQVHLRDDQELGPGGQGGAVVLDLAPDRPVIGDRVRPVHGDGVDQVDEQAGPLDVPEELVAQAVPLVRPLDQARDVGDHERPVGPRVDGPQVGILGRERIIGDLGMGPRDPREQGRLAGVRQPDEPDVGDDLQLQADPALLAGLPVLDLPRGPVGARLEMGVAIPAPSPLGDGHPIVGMLHVLQDVALVAVADDRADGDLDHEVGGAPAGASGTLAVLPVVGLPVALEREMGEVGQALRRAHDHAAAGPAVAPVGASARDVLLAPEAQAAVAAVARPHVDRHPVHEHEHPAL